MNTCIWKRTQDFELSVVSNIFGYQKIFPLKEGRIER